MIDDMRQERPYIDASAAAALLGVDRRTLEGERLAMHRARLTAVGDKAVQP